MNFWQEILSRPRDVYAKLSRGQRLGVLALVAVGIVVAVLASLLAGRQSYSVLYGGLEPEAASELVGKLAELGVPYQVSPDGSIVQVPDDRVADLKMQLAAAGLPKIGNPGYSLFDGNQLGITDSLFNVNLQRAIQGEIEKSIEKCGPVKQARVFVSLKEPGVYTRDRTRASASVTLWLRPGMPLTDSQVAAVAHLVAAGVGYGMRPEDVKISDSNFNLLYPSGEDGDPMFSVAHLQKTQAIERGLQEKAESQLRETFGEGKASVRVSVELDLKHREVATEKVDEKNKVPVKSFVDKEELAGGGATGGDPSVSTSARKGGEAKTLRSETQTEYREGVERSLEIEAAGQILRMSVSLIVDESLLAAGADGAAAPAKAEDLEAIVKNAVGFVDGKTGRKDSFKMMTAAFARPAPPEAAAGPFALENLLPLAGNLAEAVTVLVVLLTLTRIVRGGKAKAKKGAALAMALPGGVPLTGKAAKAAAKAAANGDEPIDEIQELALGEARGIDVRTRLARFVQHHPEQAREVLVAWLKEEAAA